MNHKSVCKGCLFVFEYNITSPVIISFVLCNSQSVVVCLKSLCSHWGYPLCGGCRNNHLIFHISPEFYCYIVSGGSYRDIGVGNNYPVKLCLIDRKCIRNEAVLVFENYYGRAGIVILIRGYQEIVCVGVEGFGFNLSYPVYVRWDYNIIGYVTSKGNGDCVGGIVQILSAFCENKGIILFLCYNYCAGKWAAYYGKCCRTL